MRTLKWENLREKKCPYCESNINKVGDEMKCEHCYFHIELERCKQIIEHRRLQEETSVRMKWQQLHLGRCPICSDYLTPGNGCYEVLKCANADCTFHIREDRLKDILNDESHPANKYKNKS